MTSTAVSESYALFLALGKALQDNHPLDMAQMFGKPCLKVAGKAFIAQQQEYIIFKLAGTLHVQALELPGAILWDPSGKGRPMREWVAIPSACFVQSTKLEAVQQMLPFAEFAYCYVGLKSTS